MGETGRRRDKPRLAAPRSSAAQDARPPLVMGDTPVAAGASRRVEIPVARLPTGTWSTMPVVVFHGLEPGPTVWLSAALHGDELNGIAIIRHLLGVLDPMRLCGNVVAAPMVNTFGVISESRYLPDRRDLNRSFPGSPRGSLAARLANLFMTHIVEPSDVGIDLHTGSAGRCNLPQIRCNLDDRATAKLARAFGAPAILHAAERDGSLREAATRAGAKVLLFEAGEAHRFDRAAVKVGATGVINVLANLGMLPSRKPRPPAQSREFRKSRWYRAGRSGFCEMTCDLGAEVRSGDVLAIIFSASGERERPVLAAGPGLVIGRLETAMVHRGDAVVHVAEP